MTTALFTVDMTEMHDPDTGGIGDCMRATVATLLGLPAEDVPHFVRIGIEAGDGDEGYVWWDTLLDFLLARGLWLQNHPADEPPSVPHLASGPVPRGVQHVVAVDGDGTVHDSHPSRSGLLIVTWRASFIPASEAA